MTFAEMSVILASRCADVVSAGTSDGKRFSASERLSALNSGVRFVTNAVIAGSTEDRKTHDCVYSLVTSEQVVVNSGGYNLSQLPSPVSSSGIKFVETLIGVNWVPCVEQTVNELRHRRNRYLGGSDTYPLYHVADGKLILSITVGSYPVLTHIYYIRTPKKGVYSNPTGYETTVFELADNLIEAVISAAGMMLYLVTDELDRVKMFFDMLQAQVGAVISESLVDDEKVGGIKK